MEGFRLEKVRVGLFILFIVSIIVYGWLIKKENKHFQKIFKEGKQKQTEFET